MEDHGECRLYRERPLIAGPPVFFKLPVFFIIRVLYLPWIKIRRVAQAFSVEVKAETRTLSDESDLESIFDHQIVMAR